MVDRVQGRSTTKERPTAIARVANGGTTEVDRVVDAAIDDPDDLSVDELLVEEISIDGMCGVY